MKISVVTAVLNRVDTIGDAVRSVQGQTFPNVEHVIVDGGSTDGTLDVLAILMQKGCVLKSERDSGIYDALNKGYRLATGDIVGVMHSDDMFADEEVLASVVARFADPSIEAVYGDLAYVSKSNPERVIRHWRAGAFVPGKLAWGWMPPHPTLFLRREVLEKWGVFDTRYRIAADYDAILRYFGQGRVKAAYIPRVLVRMRLGGESNRSLSRIIKKSSEDYSALKRNGVGGVGALLWKNLSKIQQFM